MNSCRLSVVVPCYNEEEVLDETITRLDNVLKNLKKRKIISEESGIIFVDDGSTDKTWEIISCCASVNPTVVGIKLSRNVGHQSALLAGLMEARKYSDCVISIDADLQDDPEAIQYFIREFKNGSDIVYGVRRSRKTDTFFKKYTALSFYKLMNIMGVNLIYNHADYRLMSKRVLDHLSEFREVNLFLRGILPQIGFKSAIVYYDRHERFAGKSKYTLKKMLSFALDGVTSFSVVPIRLIAVVGFFMFILSIITSLYALFCKYMGSTLPGWASVVISIWFIGGIQLICLGLIGEYIGKIYKEVKMRPKYIIEKIKSGSEFDEKINKLCGRQ